MQSKPSIRYHIKNYHGFNENEREESIRLFDLIKILDNYDGSISPSLYIKCIYKFVYFKINDLDFVYIFTFSQTENWKYISISLGHTDDSEWETENGGEYDLYYHVDANYDTKKSNKIDRDALEKVHRKLQTSLTFEKWIEWLFVVFEYTLDFSAIVGFTLNSDPRKLLEKY